jgi:hypothetical protein
MSSFSTTRSPLRPGGEVSRAMAVSLPPKTQDAQAGAESSAGSMASDQRAGSTMRRNPNSAAADEVWTRLGRTRWVCTSITGAVPEKASSAAARSDVASARTV